MSKLLPLYINSQEVTYSYSPQYYKSWNVLVTATKLSKTLLVLGHFLGKVLELSSFLLSREFLSILMNINANEMWALQAYRVISLLQLKRKRKKNHGWSEHM